MAGDKSGSTSQDVISSTDAQQPPVYHYRDEPVIMDF